MFKTISNTTKKTLLCVSILLIFNVCHARDISIEQRNASEAREAYQKAKNENQSLTEQISAQEKKIADEQARLDLLIEKQTASQNNLEHTKQNLDKQVEILKQVWDQRTR